MLKLLNCGIQLLFDLLQCQVGDESSYWWEILMKQNALVGSMHDVLPLVEPDLWLDLLLLLLHLAFRQFLICLGSLLFLAFFDWLVLTNEFRNCGFGSLRMLLFLLSGAGCSTEILLFIGRPRNRIVLPALPS